MKIKQLIPHFLLLSGILAANIFVTTPVNAADSASEMVNVTNKKVLVGYWHNWASKGKDGYKQGTSANISLAEVNKAYNVVPVSFMKSDGINRIPTFAPYNKTDADFRKDVGALNSQGRTVLLALGGADAHIQLKTGDEQAFADEIIRQVETYGFDGLDIDLEQSAITAGDNQTVIPTALKKVKDYYKAQGKTFTITMAPEFPYLKPGGAYEKYLTSLDGYYDYIAPQLYNQGGDGVWVDEINKWIPQSNDALKYEFLYYMSDSMIHGTRTFLKIPNNKLVLGLPANNDGAGSGYVIDPTAVYKTFGQLAKDGNPIKGLMTWSANWDVGTNSSGVPYNNEFANRYVQLLQ
ncbi:chitinase [Candidatus Enterococcus mansonii]|uniref:chitinase n=1 Tax=Candidatus Enterococcus mansonii TaxID=1834181 RepID=A0A242CE43_9ENTE|nr:chitinase [Enterococcus sp. 4G2_DIV0659]OTO08190.1 chitinase family 2 protein [Enterococcus sp. 4G2_DIV0659]